MMCPPHLIQRVEEMKVVVTGAGGQLGHDVVEALCLMHEVIGLGRRQMDLLDRSAIESVLTKAAPECIVHCGAYTKVDQAEVEREICSRINVDATATISRIAATMGSKLVYISTDYVFDGAKVGEYETDDHPNPVNYYGLTKLKGEEAISEFSEESFIIRTSWVYGRNGNNFVKAILKKSKEQGTLRVVDDQVGSPTSTTYLARLISDMIATNKFGLYHATNEGACSRYEFAKEILMMSGIDGRVEPITTEQYGAKAVRPKNSQLSKLSLDAGGFHRLPDWKDALRRYLVEDAILSTEGLE
jgi:dTDP-4-dehydrorhamnose reductase